MIKLKALFIFAMVLLITSCSAPDVDYYQGTEPKFDFKQFFSGELKAYGVNFSVVKGDYCNIVIYR